VGSAGITLRVFTADPPNNFSPIHPAKTVPEVSNFIVWIQVLYSIFRIRSMRESSFEWKESFYRMIERTAEPRQFQKANAPVKGEKLCQFASNPPVPDVVC
jgi:hypothetical protein